jgi:transcriptional regulator with XRE-family HTH domain
MITLSQIRAARALLGWTQEALAEASKVSLPSINNLERGLYSPRPETLQSLVVALEHAGVEFTANNGLRLRQEEHHVITYTGPEFIRDLDLDILSVIQGPKDEIIGVSCDERKWMEYGSVTNPVYIKAREQTKWTERFIIPDTAKFITSPPNAYRTLNADHIGKINYEIYGNRFAIIEWEAMRVTVTRNNLIADMFKKQFDALWGIARPLAAKQLNKIERLPPSKGRRK